MPTTASVTARQKSADVEAYFKAQDHHLKPAWLELRKLILGCDASISEGIKWKVPSFRTTEYFATLQVRATDGVQVILHLGAKARGKSARGVKDAGGILEWASDDRAIAKFADLKDLRAKRGAFQSLVRQWITYL